MTPLMKQYWEIKAQHTDKVLFFRMGDFYELFFEDAILAAPLLGITLTSRNKKSQDETPMCGMPHFSVVGHINRLLSLGHKVALCDQIEDPKLAKGIVKRAVTRVLTPGMVYDVDSLDQTKPFYLCSFDERSVSFLDMTTGEAFWVAHSGEPREIKKLITQFSAVELVISTPQMDFAREQFPNLTLSPFDSQGSSSARLLEYVKAHNLQQNLNYIRPFQEKTMTARLLLSATTQRHLELFVNSKNEVQGSLIGAIDKCSTSAGSRKLREWLKFPLVNEIEISKRLDEIEKYQADVLKLKQLRTLLMKLGDLERRLAKISQSHGSARDLQSLSQCVLVALAALEQAQISFSESARLKTWAEKIQNTLMEELPLTLKNGGLIRKGVQADLDLLITLSTDTHQVLSDLENQEKAQTGIGSLKIRYNQVFGYYIEVTNTHKDKIPERYKRKQTLTSAERFYTEELLELEKKILSSDVKRAELEFQIFEELKTQTLNLAAPISWLAELTSELDVYLALAWLSIESNFVRPQFSEDQNLKLIASRHPVVEKSVSRFVANDLSLNHQDCLLLTGPNMAGKSTLMRQVALISVLAQMGSFVPAKSARLPIYSQIFTRIGAQDQLSEGLSTFMVEMTETAELLQSANQKTLVILDEIGRGTSTYDGLSLAEAILEYLVQQKISQVLFATHYHEITELSTRFKNLINAHMSVVENRNQIEFLHSLVLKPAGQSYGIQVARLAGLPAQVIQMAFENLKKRTATGPLDQPQQLSFLNQPPDPEIEKLKLLAFQITQHSILEKTPLESLQAIQSWQAALKDKI
jgi:DNA mismatch repair protein MutS